MRARTHSCFSQVSGRQCPLFVITGKWLIGLAPDIPGEWLTDQLQKLFRTSFSGCSIRLREPLWFLEGCFLKAVLVWNEGRKQDVYDRLEKPLMTRESVWMDRSPEHLIVDRTRYRLIKVFFHESFQTSGKLCTRSFPKLHLFSGTA